MQWIHVGPGAITDDLADIPCSDMQAIDLLDQLNSVHDTGYSLDVPGLQKCLEYTLRQSRDFGVAYGTLRPWWSSDFTEVVDHLEQQRIRLEYTRSNAIRGQCIIDSDIPARRIWDLYSNRVLPFHVLPRVPDSWAEAMPPIIWCVSHSWVDERDRHDVWTRINSEEWPVPLPRTTSLSHIRVELLNMGAQYVWLDVLCLRQRGGRLAEADAERAAEWRLDVPTIGKIYQRWQATCIIYFNGLGLPLDTTPAVLSSPQHWCNRAWTLQEGCRGWLPAGIDPSRPIGHDFFRGLDERRGQLTGFLCNLESAVFMRDRFCSTELDKIAGLAYIFQTRTLPVYSERTPVEHAWLLLLKNLQEDLRTQIFFQYAPATPFEIWVPWERFIEGRPELPFWDSIWILDDRPKDDREPLQLLNTDDLYTNNPQPRYCHEGWAIGHCRVATTIRQTTGDAKKNIRLNVRRRSESSSLVFAGMTGLLLPEVEYFLIAFELGHRKGYPPWLIAIEVVAEEEASTSEAGTQGLKTVEGVRWAVLYMDKDQKVALDSGSPDTRVVYLPGEEALARTQYRKQYLSALAETSLIR
ncbi:hypothetical protein PsYK624_168750 [Phanerochaete sordida]|uniref:Heterokaryon incompatibility domain-containing protein n=1 Tax=Phanerochaete sordida TaxID=48140 RepID=A0A9P3GSR8_9APHY|nr:hypothetical protein PsYK624_168750 [Phanerochaete sordida]